MGQSLRCGWRLFVPTVWDFQFLEWSCDINNQAPFAKVKSSNHTRSIDLYFAPKSDQKKGCIFYMSMFSFLRFMKK